MKLMPRKKMKEEQHATQKKNELEKRGNIQEDAKEKERDTAELKQTLKKTSGHFKYSCRHLVL